MPSRRSRHDYSVPHKGPFLVCVAFALLHFLSLVSVATFGYILLRTHDLSIARWLALSVVAVGITWLMSFAARRVTRCPLCKGTPLLDTPATKHHKAVRLKPFNYGTTAQLHLIFTHRFRCMDCGTPFDLLRKRGQRHR